MKTVTMLAAVVLLTGGASRGEAKNEMMTLTGCVQGFAQGGYFLSDTVDEKGKVKHYLLVNDNEELKEHEGRLVEVTGTPAEFSWSVKITAQDGRELKARSVFGVDEVRVVQDACRAE
jgi:hypothetical protein